MGHDDYLPNGNYEQSYNELVLVHACNGKLKSTGCRRDDASVVESLNCNKEEQVQQDALTQNINPGDSGSSPTSMKSSSESSGLDGSDGKALPKLPNSGGSGA